MKIYKISQDKIVDYDTYDSAVVIAANEEEARHIHPGNISFYFVEYGWRIVSQNIERIGWGDSWAPPDDVCVEYIGEASPALTEKQIICASFNAG